MFKLYSVNTSWRADNFSMVWLPVSKPHAVTQAGKLFFTSLERMKNFCFLFNLSRKAC